MTVGAKLLASSIDPTPAHSYRAALTAAPFRRALSRRNSGGSSARIRAGLVATWANRERRWPAVILLAGVALRLRGMGLLSSCCVLMAAGALLSPAGGCAHCV